MSKPKVLYLMRYTESIDDAKKIKFDGQINGLRKLGYDVHYIAYNDKSFYLVTNNERIYLKTVIVCNSGLYFHTKFFSDLCKVSTTIIKKYEYNFVYIRTMYLGMSGVRLNRKIFNEKMPIIVELPTFIANGAEKHRNWVRKIASIYLDWCNKLSANYVSFFVLIGDKANAYMRRPAINIANGIDVENCPLRNAIFDMDVIHLVSVSSMAYWHGYDRLIRGLANYQEKDFKVIYHVIGKGAMNEPWRELAKQLGVDDKVIFHGAMFGEELYSFLDTCDVGIGALGAYRKAIDITSELKIREYTAYGLPFIYGTKDVTIRNNFEYSARIPNDDSDVNIGEVVAFALKMRTEKDVSEEMHAYAAQHMSWEGQWEKILNQLAQD